MALQRQWTFPANTATSNNGEVVTITPQAGLVNQPGFNAGLDSLQVPNIVTAPANSASVYAPASYTAQTASVATVVQNTLGYDAIFTPYFYGSPSVATFSTGVSSTSPVAMTSVLTAITATNEAVSFPTYVPANYYYSFQVTQANAASVPSAQLTIQATPV